MKRMQLSMYGLAACLAIAAPYLTGCGGQELASEESTASL